MLVVARAVHLVVLVVTGAVSMAVFSLLQEQVMERVMIHELDTV